MKVEDIPEGKYCKGCGHLVTIDTLGNTSDPYCKKLKGPAWIEFNDNGWKIPKHPDCPSLKVVV